MVAASIGSDAKPAFALLSGPPPIANPLLVFQHLLLLHLIFSVGNRARFFGFL
jgi:hypothetical protein